MEKYVPSCTEEQFKAVQALLLNEASTELTRIIRDLDYGAFEVNEEFPDRAWVEEMAENAVAMGLMTKRVIKNYPCTIYQAVIPDRKVA